MAGVSRYGNWPMIDVPDGGSANTLPSFQCTQKIDISTAAVTKSGIDDVAKPVLTTTRSAGLSWRRAGEMPAAMEIGVVMMKASNANFPERDSAGKMILVTGLPVWYEFPKSRVKTRRIDVRYWLMSGRSVPIWWLNLTTSSCNANGPSTRRPTLPGKTLTMKNTIVAKTHRVTKADAIRRRTYRPMQPPSGIR